MRTKNDSVGMKTNQWVTMASGIKKAERFAWDKLYNKMNLL